MRNGIIYLFPGDSLYENFIALYTSGHSSFCQIHHDIGLKIVKQVNLLLNNNYVDEENAFEFVETAQRISLQAVFRRRALRVKS